MHFAQQPPRRRQSLLLGLGAVIAGLCVGAIVIAVATGSGEDEASPDRSPRFVTVSQLATQPTKYFGTEVGMTTEVAEVLGARALLLGGMELQGGASLLAVGKEPFARPGARKVQRALVEGDLVQVTGTLRIFDAEELEQRFGLSPADRLKRFAGEPVMVVEEILVTPRLLIPTGQVTTEQIGDRPGAYLGDLVAVEGRVTDIVRGEALVLDGGLLVLAGGLEAGAVEAGDTVTVRGGVRRLDPDQFPGRRGGLDEDLFGELIARPALVAQSIDIHQQRRKDPAAPR